MEDRKRERVQERRKVTSKDVTVGTRSGGRQVRREARPDEDRPRMLGSCGISKQDNFRIGQDCGLNFPASVEIQPGKEESFHKNMI